MEEHVALLKNVDGLASGGRADLREVCSEGRSVVIIISQVIKNLG